MELFIDVRDLPNEHAFYYATGMQGVQEITGDTTKRQGSGVFRELVVLEKLPHTLTV